MTGEEREDRAAMAAIEADVVSRFQVAMEALAAEVMGLVPPVDLSWVDVEAREVPAPVDPMDVAWPDGTFKVFPDRAEFTVNVELAAPDARDTWAHMFAIIQREQLERAVLEDLSQIITERGAEAPGLLIVRNPVTGEWAITESEWLARGSAVVSTSEEPDLMAVARESGGFLYYRGPDRVG